MGHYQFVSLFAALLCLLLGAIGAYFVIQARMRARKLQRRDENQARRERLAAKRIADNGGHPLSARFSTSDASSNQSKRSV